MAKIPKFNNEAEEAAWWSSEEGQAHTTAKFERAAAAGKVNRGIPAEVVRAVSSASRSVPIHIRVPKEDLEAAKLVAKRKGLGYQTYLKMLMHEGVQRDTARPKRRKFSASSVR